MAIEKVSGAFDLKIFPMFSHDTRMKICSEKVLPIQPQQKLSRIVLYSKFLLSGDTPIRVL